MQSMERPILVEPETHTEPALAADADACAASTVSAQAVPACGLNELPRDRVAVIERIQMPNHPHGHGRALVLRLLELGFVPGERVRIIATGPGGKEPIAVRVGGTTFALRLHEAEHIRVRPVREPS